MEPSTSPHCEAKPSRVPEWLTSLLASSYFTPCSRHAALHRSERNFFCVACGGTSICSICVQKEHSGYSHTVLQIRKSSYHDAVRISDVGKLLDLAGIQVYVINGAKIVFLNGRPQAKPVKGAPYHCESCQRTLLDACRFCSIGCKLAAMPVDASLSIIGVPTKKEGGLDGLHASIPTGQPRKQHGDATALAMSDDESLDSGFRHGNVVRHGNAFRHGNSPRESKVASPRMHSALPRLPMLLEEQDDVSSGDSCELQKGAEEGLARLKRRRPNEPEEVTSAFPPLEDMMMPGTPPLGTPFPLGSWRTHKRKGVPHRSPLA